MKAWKKLAKHATSDRPQGQYLTWSGGGTWLYKCANRISLNSGVIPDGYYAGSLAYFIVIDGNQTSEWVISNEPFEEDPDNVAGCELSSQQCDYTGNGINLDGTEDTSFSTTVRGTLADSTTGESGTFSGWAGTNYPVKIVLDENGNVIQVNGNNVMFFPSSVTASNCSTSTPYDCINGACRPATEYNTPGLYPSLSDCEVACGTGCSGQCVSNKDWSSIQGLANKLKNKNCS